MAHKWTRALVTGASSGIGRAISQQLAAAGTHLVVVARDKQALEQLAAEVSVPCEILVADLSDQEQLARVEQRIGDRGSQVDLLVNNAGFGFVGRFDQLDIEKETAVITVNMLALLRLSHAAAQAMVSRGGVRGILNVSSVAGFVPAPNSATYAATKAFVTSFTEALHEELKPEGIHVSALCPGYTRTDFQRRANAEAATNRVPTRLWQSADAVAKAGLAGVARNHAIVVPGAHNKALAGLASALPRDVVRKIVSIGSR